MQVQSLSWEDPLEEGVANHSSILAWRIPCTEKPGGFTVHAAAKSWIQLKRLSTHASMLVSTLRFLSPWWVQHEGQEFKKKKKKSSNKRFLHASKFDSHWNIGLINNRLISEEEKEKEKASCSV